MDDLDQVALDCMRIIMSTPQALFIDRTNTPKEALEIYNELLRRDDTIPIIVKHPVRGYVVGLAIPAGLNIVWVER